MAFLLGRSCLRDCASEWFHSNSILAGLDTVLRDEGLKINLLLRLSPLVPYNVMNFAMGVTATRLDDYTVGCLGMLPSIILMTYFGSALANFSDLASLSGRHPVEMTILYVRGVTVRVLLIRVRYNDAVIPTEGGTGKSREDHEDVGDASLNLPPPPTSEPSRRLFSRCTMQVCGAVLLLIVTALLYSYTKRAIRDAIKRRESLVDSYGWDATLHMDNGL
jgi:hypothetical protein